MVCMARSPVLLSPIGDGCSINHSDGFVGGNHELQRYGSMPLPFCGTVYQNLLWPVVYHGNCLCNMLLAIRNRVIAKCPAPQPERIKELRELCRSVAAKFGHITQQDPDSFYKLYGRGKRLKYHNAYLKYCDIIGDVPGRITAFVKPDKINPFEKLFAIPRAIQYREPVYAVALAQFLKPLEHMLYKFKFLSEWCTSGTRFVAKGMNQKDRAYALIKKTKQFVTFAVVSLDMSRFDMHVNKELLKVEHLFYNLIVQHPNLVKLLKVQLKNRGSYKNRKNFDEWLKYTAEGRRMSGDMNTALGNCILMILMTILYLESLKVKYELLDDGDDLLVIIDACNVDLLKTTVTEFYLGFGMNVKIEGVAYTIPEVQFCQSSPINTANGWKFVRNPFKIMSTSLSGSRWACDSERHLRSMVLGQGICEGVLNDGVPVLAAYANALVRNANVSPDRVKFDERTGVYLQFLKEIKGEVLPTKFTQEITDTARETFALAFKVPIVDQLRMEVLLDNWVIDFLPPVLIRDRFDPVTWKFDDNLMLEFHGLPTPN